MSKKLLRIPKQIVIALIVFACIIALPAIPNVLQGLYLSLNDTWRLSIDLFRISLITFLFAAFLSPLEALSWWAGWYGDKVDTNIDPGTLVEPIPLDNKVSRYIIYLDGISQTKFDYLPDAEKFLDDLAAILPDDILIVKGLIPYSVFNKPLTEDRLFSFFWRLADRLQISKSGGLIGFAISFTIQIRNLLQVAVSADERYGPIYNQGTAQVMYNSLVTHGYQPGSNVPITLIGYSGGGQISLGAAPYLQKTLEAPIDVISISGVFSGNNNFLKLEHFYHFVGKQDFVEKVGPISFPKRWQLLFLSYWNRAKRLGKVTITSLGEVGHSDVGGPFDPNKCLPDGRTYLCQTIDWVAGIVQGNSSVNQIDTRSKVSNYQLYQQAEFNDPSYYPIEQKVDPQLYRAIAPWMGRLILPKLEERRRLNGVWMEVYHADEDHQHLVGRIVKLGWSQENRVQNYIKEVTKDLHFSDDAEYSQKQGNIHPYRLNRWQQVNPLESLAGSRPNDDVIVMLNNPDVFENKIIISSEPVQITGRFYAVVQIISSSAEQFKVVHFNPISREFDGIEETVYIPQVIADQNGVFPSSKRNLEKSIHNSLGWYIYGAKNQSGIFVVQAIAPRGLLRLQPDQVIFGKRASWRYLKKQSWQVKGEKGRCQSVLLSSEEKDINTAISEWQEGDWALLLHVYGGIGGKKIEPAAKSPIFFGHFAYGMARVVREPITQELIFDIHYYQVYTHNTDGIIAGKLAWPRYLGDRQFGWLGTRPVADIIIKLDAFTENYEVNDIKASPLGVLIRQLESMTARYRIGDGTGGTYVGPAHNCAQDSNQAFYRAIRSIEKSIKANPEVVRWFEENPEQNKRFQQLVKLGKYIKRELFPLGTARADWEGGNNTLGISPEEDAFQGIMMGLASWRTMFPRLASETITKEFINMGASVWILRTNQVGGEDPDIEPIAPTAF